MNLVSDPAREGPSAPCGLTGVRDRCLPGSDTFYAYTKKVTCSEGGGTFYFSNWGQYGGPNVSIDWNIVGDDHCTGDQYGEPFDFGGGACPGVNGTGSAGEIEGDYDRQLPEGVQYIDYRKNKDVFYGFLKLKDN